MTEQQAQHTYDVIRKMSGLPAGSMQIMTISPFGPEQGYRVVMQAIVHIDTLDDLLLVLREILALRERS